MLCFNCGRYWSVGYETMQKLVSGRLYALPVLVGRSVYLNR
jgi:hypothetical protein